MSSAPGMTREQALRTLADYMHPAVQAATLAAMPPDIVDWAERHFYIADTGMPIVLQPHQKAFFWLVTQLGMPNIVYSTCKKCLALDTPVPIMHRRRGNAKSIGDGWTTMRDIVVGDVVFDEHGYPCNVVEVGPVYTGRPCYMVSFSDGSFVVTDAGHEWPTSYLLETNNFDYGTRTTLRIAASLVRGDGAYRHRVLGPPVLQRTMGVANRVRQGAVAFTDRANERRYITGVVQVPSEPVRCIQVDAPSHQFLITEALVPTCNSGKTAMSGLYSRYRAQFSGNNAEIYFIAHDKEQAKDRAYEAARVSIELTPGYVRRTRELPGQWRIVEKQAVHTATGSKMQALAGEYEGAAGGNPTLTSFTELWAFTGERFKRLWDELTPVPTRERSERLVETYAGFIDESELLWNVYKQAVQRGHRLSRSELEKYVPAGVDPWPFPDEPRFYVNQAAGMFAYWDDGPAAQQRMPWQITPRGVAYYREQEANLREEAYQRLHLNYWVSSAQNFIEPAWWAACKSPLQTPLPQGWPVVVAVDGSVSSDCTAVVGVAREPVMSADGKLTPSDTDVRVVFAHVWVPPRGGVIDLDDVEAYLRHICGHHDTIERKWSDREYADRWKDESVYNVVQITYDAYQLHQLMTTLAKDYIAWTRPFSQAGDREIADKQLYDLILRKGIHHNDEFDAEYVSNAAAYVAGAAAKNANRLRIVKKAADMKVDPVVATSMACKECLRLLLS